jgi:hypothetical protein
VGISATIEQRTRDSDVTAACRKQQRRTATCRRLDVYVGAEIQQCLNGRSVEVGNSEQERSTTLMISRIYVSATKQ